MWTTSRKIGKRDEEHVPEERIMTTVTLAIQQMGLKLGRIDRVVLATALIFAALTLADGAQSKESVFFVLDNLLFISPFLILSVAIAAGAKATGMDQQIALAFKGSPLTSVVLAAAFGAFSPFCSCGVIPLIAGLLGAGVPLAPVMAFWIASPIMDPEMFILTSAVLGLDFAVAKTLAALGMGLIAGFSTHLMVAGKMFADPLRAAATSCCGSTCGAPETDEVPAIVWKFWREDERLGLFRAEFLSAGWFLLKWMTFAFVIESLMVAYIPDDMVASWLGGGEWWVIPVSVFAGIPAYLNGFAAIPTIDGLLQMGMAPGAALAFMIAGSVTCIPAAIAVYALVKKHVFAWYVMLGVAGSLAAGIAFEAFSASV